MDDNQVWAIVSPRSAIHVARLEHRSIFPGSPDGPTIGWVWFPCMGGPERAVSDLACCTDDEDEMKVLADGLGSRGMFCVKAHCADERRRLMIEKMRARAGISRETIEEELDVETTVNNNYEDAGWGIEAWQVMVTLCVLVAIITVGGLIWHGIDMSRADNTAHEKTLQVKYASCALDDSPRLCLQKVQE